MKNIEKIANEIIKKAVSPPKWKKTVEKMKENSEIDNPWALAWWMSQQGKGDPWGAGGTLTKKPKPSEPSKK